MTIYPLIPNPLSLIHCPQQKQYSDLFGLAAEDEGTSVVGRRGASGRGRKPAPSKKETNSASAATTNSADRGGGSGGGSGSSSKKANNNNNNDVSSEEETSEVSTEGRGECVVGLTNGTCLLQDEWTKGKNAKRRKKASLSDSD